MTDDEVAAALAAQGYTPEIDAETRRRCLVTLWAYAYEVVSDPIVSDAEFDETAARIDLTINTRRPDLDAFFRKEFSPFTGQWIWKHPELDRVAAIYKRMRGKA